MLFFGKPWLAAGIFAAFTYFKTAYDNRNPVTGKWAWNFMSWFGKDKNTTFVVGINTNTSFSNVTGFTGVGVGPYMPAFAVNSNSGVGFGVYTPQGADFIYPGVKQRPDYRSNLASNVWNNSIVRAYSGDAIFVNTTFSLVFLGGGSNATGLVLPLRGPDAFKLNFINTASLRLAAQGGWDVSVGKMWFNGPVESAYVREMNGNGNSIDANFGLAFGWGPGIGVFEGYSAGRTTWFGTYGSFGFGIGGSLGFDYTYTTPVFGK